MTWPDVVSIAVNLGAAGLNLGLLFYRERRYRRLRREVNDLIPPAAFCLALAHPSSPAPRDIKAAAAAAVPEWFRKDTRVEVTNIVPPSGGVH